MNSQTLNNLRRMVEEVAIREGCYLYDIEFVGGQGGRTLRVTIDKSAEGGASVEDCGNVSKGLNLLLDVEDVVPGGAYNLEVSSPGLERVLKEPRHFERVIGKQISVKTFQPLVEFNEHLPELGKAKQLQGVLLAFDEKGLKLDAGPSSPGKQISIPFETVTKAHVVFEFVNPSENKPGKGPKKGKAEN
jgi:ribosome maturation factor RimP